ncbi:MAG: hypothetical protein NZM38_07005 [Cytophagales bacterium]|nr:hypothetical protein [Cytophagales bacterium]MDW8384505.1 hypothetical protein [Flammeovirgaceae bacterium]
MKDGALRIQVKFLLGVILLIIGLFLITPYRIMAEQFLHLVPVEKQELFLQKFFTCRQYWLLKFFVGSIGLAIGIIYSRFQAYLELGMRDLFVQAKEWWLSCRSTYQNWTYTEKFVFWFLLIGVGSVQIFFSFAYPIHIDEAFSYVFFAHKGLGVTLAFYPGPNNHIGYTILVSLLAKFMPSLMAIRIPVLLQSIMTYAFAYSWIVKRYGILSAVCAIVLFAFSEYGLFYSVHGRGYWAVMFSTYLAFWLLEKYFQTPQRVYLFVFVFVCLYGFYCVPVFLYPFLSILVWLGWRLHQSRYFQWRSWAVALVLIGIGTILLYAPVLIFNDWQTITANPWVLRGKSSFWKDYVKYCIEVNAAFYGTECAGFWLVVALWSASIVGLFVRSCRNVSFWILCVGLLPFGFILFQQVLPFTRVWLYKSALEFGIIGILLGYYLSKTTWQKCIVSFLLVLYSFWQLRLHYIRLQTDGNLYRNAIACAHRILQEKPRLVYANHDLYQVILRYEAIQKNCSVLIETKSLSEKVDIILEDKKFPLLSKGDLLWEDDQVRVWKLVQT